MILLHLISSNLKKKSTKNQPISPCRLSSVAVCRKRNRKIWYNIDWNHQWSFLPSLVSAVSQFGPRIKNSSSSRDMGSYFWLYYSAVQPTVLQAISHTSCMYIMTQCTFKKQCNWKKVLNLFTHLLLWDTDKSVINGLWTCKLMASMQHAPHLRIGNYMH